VADTGREILVHNNEAVQRCWHRQFLHVKSEIQRQDSGGIDLRDQKILGILHEPYESLRHQHHLKDLGEACYTFHDLMVQVVG
jgi:hypothetical protein